MKEAIFIGVILFVLAGVTAIRYRRQLVAMLDIWRMLRSIQINAPRGNRIENEKKSSGPLVNCPKCGAWIPENKAIKLGRASYYCSVECVEKAAKTV